MTRRGVTAPGTNAGSFAPEAREESGVLLCADPDDPDEEASGLSRPVTEGSWFHGTRAAFDEFAPGGLSAREDWNTVLGNHFARERSVSELFAGHGPERSAWEVSRLGLEPEPGGRVYEVTLSIKNPKVYAMESELSEEAAALLLARGYRLACHPTPTTAAEWDALYEEDPDHYDAHGYEVTALGGEYDDRFVYWMAGHAPEVQGRMALEFKKHLTDQGYDGVVYGNECEGSYGNECAIAFEPDQIRIADVDDLGAGPGHLLTSGQARP